MGNSSAADRSDPERTAQDPYADLRWTPREGEGLRFDEQYRAAHLPHVAPGHPLATDHWPGRDYHHGRYERARVSLVADLGLPFAAHDTCRELAQALAGSSFAGKVALELMERRAASLHCTLIGDVDPDAGLRQAANRIARGMSPLAPVLHGPFIGKFNRGRIYLPLEFDRPADRASLDVLSGLYGRTRPIFTAIGLVNFRDELDAREAQELTALMSSLRGARARLRLTRLSWTSTHDDLTLDMRRLETIALSEPERS